MKFTLLSAALSATAALGMGLTGSAALAASDAPVVHRTSVVHQGQALGITYEPQVETRLRQIGLGPRSSPACMWTSKVSVQRTAVGPDGRPIAALSRVIAGDKARSGQRAGHCNNLSERERARLAGKSEALQAQLIAAAERDSHGLRAELASLESLGKGDSHAR